MRINENYNSAKQKYGDNVVKPLFSQGIQDKYLLAACKFYVKDKIPIETLVEKFKNWNRYVGPYDKTDVNTLTFIQFNNLILSYVQKATMPNKLYDDGNVQIGEFRTFKEAYNFPIENTWCIAKQNKWFHYYKSGCEHILIVRYCGNQYVVALLEKGNISFIDTHNHEISERTPECDALEQRLGTAMYKINDLADDYDRRMRGITESVSKQINKKNYIRLSENQLHRIVKESIDRIINE